MTGPVRDELAGVRRRLAEDLLVSGSLRIVRVWPRALDAEALTPGGRLVTVTVRPSRWWCGCGASDKTAACAHVLAVRLVAGDGVPGPFSEVWP